MAHYSRLMLVACRIPNSVRAELRGTERAIVVSQLGVEEWLDIELGRNGQADMRYQIRADGSHPLPSGFSWCVITKNGQGSPTTVELANDG